jgi:hypothetical protein
VAQAAGGARGGARLTAVRRRTAAQVAARAVQEGEADHDAANRPGQGSAEAGGGSAEAGGGGAGRFGHRAAPRGLRARPRSHADAGWRGAAGWRR